jgi:hypothetical protein
MHFIAENQPGKQPEKPGQWLLPGHFEPAKPNQEPTCATLGGILVNQ